MQRPFQLHASPRAEQSVRMETFRHERASSRLDSSRGSHTFHPRPSAPTVQQRHLHARRNTIAARLHELRASKIAAIRRKEAGTSQHMGFENVFSPETGRKQMAAHYRPTPPEQALQRGQINLRDTQLVLSGLLWRSVQKE
jgi:hypothetical protein